MSERLLVIYRSPLFGLGVVLPALLVVLFWGQRSYLNPAYWSLDGLWVLKVYGSAAHSYPPVELEDWGDGAVPAPDPDIQAIARLLRADDHAGLEALATRAPVAFSQFQDTSPDLAAKLDEWVAADPASASARYARGKYWYTIGWRRRGAKWASLTSNSQFRGMRTAFEQAEADLLAVIERDPGNIFAYPRLLRIYSASRSRQPDEAAIWQRAIDAGAGSTDLHRSLFIALMPRWSGLSYPQSIAAIRAVLESIEHGELRGTGDPELLRAFPIFVEAEGLWRNDRRNEALELYETFIDGPSGGFYLDDYARRLRSHKRIEEARKYYAASLRFAPTVVDVIEDYAHMLFRIHHYDKVEMAVERGLAVDPYHTGLLLVRADLNVARGHLREALADVERAAVYGGGESAVTARLHWLRSALAG